MHKSVGRHYCAELQREREKCVYRKLCSLHKDQITQGKTVM